VHAVPRERARDLEVRVKAKKAKRPRPDDGTWRDDWNTPAAELALVRAAFGPIVLDPCWNQSAQTNPAIAAWTESPDPLLCDGLDLDWATELRWRPSTSEGGCVFVNPPYSELRRWLTKCAGESSKVTMLGHAIVALVPARVEQPCWTDVVHTVDAIAFRQGRIIFDHPEGAPAQTASFPVALLVWHPLRRAIARKVARQFARGWWCAEVAS
jgi:hypothetical protein